MSITCGPMVSLYEAQETVDRLIEAAGSTIDIKFGVSINAELDDQILASVIASDFQEEYDFTNVPQYQAPIKPYSSRPIEPLNLTEEDKDDEGEEEKEEDDILPSYLKDLNLN